MAEFLEERLPEDLRMGASYVDGFNVEITETAGDSEHRSLRHPFPRRETTFFYTKEKAAIWGAIVALYYRAYGSFAGFRVRNIDDFSTNGHTQTPTAFDNVCELVSSGVYQLQKFYGQGSPPLSIGYPKRTLFKPVDGTVKVGISSVEVPASRWSVDTANGKITFAANKTAAITGISKAASAVISCAGHTFIAGESVYISGVAGMTQINGLRGLITTISAGVSITVAINSTAFSTWTSGGVLNTNPQTGEPVSAGCEFDIPCRFNSKLEIHHVSFNARESGRIDIIELVNP